MNVRAGPLFADGELLDNIKGMKYKRCVSEGRARKELYQMMFEADPMIDKFYTCTMNAAYTSSRVLGTWELAGAAQLDKHNGKMGTAGVRLIMMLDPMGKAYYWMLHKRTREAKTYFGYGFYEHRRREQAILVHHAVAGRLRQAARCADFKDKNRFSHISNLRDIANAFPSVDQDELGRTIMVATDAWTGCQLKARHELMHVMVRTRQGDGLVFAPRTGGVREIR